ncbi:MAG TPA: hypothetical protein VN754_13915 [Candidatus Binataceae bacterium]|nr:hypothetical protein [Candidatus Binataceae bacterium]
MSSMGLEERDQVASSPNLTRRMILVFLTVFNRTLLLAMLFNASPASRFLEQGSELAYVRCDRVRACAPRGGCRSNVGHCAAGQCR